MKNKKYTVEIYKFEGVNKILVKKLYYEDWMEALRFMGNFNGIARGTTVPRNQFAFGPYYGTF